MGPVLLLLFISSICYLFWMQRKQDERAFVIARQLCQQQQLQLLDCGRSGHSGCRTSLARCRGIPNGGGTHP